MGTGRGHKHGGTHPTERSSHDKTGLLQPTPEGRSDARALFFRTARTCPGQIRHVRPPSAASAGLVPGNEQDGGRPHFEDGGFVERDVVDASPHAKSQVQAYYGRKQEAQLGRPRLQPTHICRASTDAHASGGLRPPSSGAFSDTGVDRAGVEVERRRRMGGGEGNLCRGASIGS